MRRRTFEVGPDRAGQTLGRLVESTLALAPPEAAAYIARGAVYVAGRRCLDASRKLEAGARVAVVLSESGRSATTEEPGLEPTVLHEDDWVIALDKPPHMPSQPTPARAGTSAWDWVRRRFGNSAGLVHRLDRETSGVIVFGRHPRATSALSAQFRERQVEKEYRALTLRGLDEGGRVTLPISPDPSRPGRYRASDRANGVPARTGYKRLFEAEAWAGVALFPETGRTHQLRAHLAALGFPILGDHRYGGPRRVAERDVTRCLLHAHRLTLRHPETGRPLVLAAPLPPDFAPFWPPGA